MGDSSKTFGKLTIPLLLLLAICLSTFPAQAKYGGGSGTPEDPYLIHDANHMQAIGADANDWDKHFKLMADIDLSGYTGTEFNIIGRGHIICDPLGYCWFVGTPFTGVFDGNGHTISYFTYEYNGGEFVGLFGCVDGESAQIKNLGLRDVDIDTDYGERVGPFVGLLFNGTVINCFTQGGSVSGDYRVGGLVGRSEEPASICNCYTDVNVSGHGDIGGLVGWNFGTISKCYSKGSTVGVYEVGGLTGRNFGAIIDSYSTGSVSGRTNVGGLAGENRGIINNCHSSGIFEGETHVGGLVGISSGTIAECNSTGSVSGYDDIGGLVGVNWVGTISNCYTTCDVEGTECVGGLAGFNRRTVINCYATGSVSGTIDVGGLVGRNGGQGLSGVVTNCYSTAPVMGTTNVGGLVGINEVGTVTDSFWDVIASSQSNMCGSQGSGATGCNNGNGKSTAEMQTQSTFTDAGWDFVNIWDICEGTNYPRFLLQIPLGDFVCPDGVNFFDYSFFASQWAEDNCWASNDCDGRDLDQLGSVDINDLRIFVDNWLKGF